MNPFPKISTSRYELEPRHSLGAHARSGMREGALLKFEFPESAPGYADCHPWTELGDAPLEEQLRLLKDATPTPLTRSALLLASIDSQHRTVGKSCFEGLEIPSSHFLLSDCTDAEQTDDAVQALLSGFTRIKVKLGRALREEVLALKKLIPRLEGKAKLRLDFNSRLSPDEFAGFEDVLGEDRTAIDFVEDPTVWTRQTGFLGLKTSLPLAVDREVESVRLEALCPEVLVVKPAASDWRGLFERARRWNRRLTVTSYLDHPLGQLSAAYVAAQGFATQREQMTDCGLLSHGAFEPNEFSRALQCEGPKMLTPGGTGFGFDELLSKQIWKELSV